MCISWMILLPNRAPFKGIHSGKWVSVRYKYTRLQGSSITLRLPFIQIWASPKYVFLVSKYFCIFLNISRYSPKNIKLLFLKYSTIGELFVNLKSFTLCRILILWKVCKSSGKGYDLFHKMFIHTHVPPCPERDPTVCVCVLRQQM